MITRAQILILISFLTGSVYSAANRYPIAEQAYMIIKTAEKYHYSPVLVNDSFSCQVYKSFLHLLDPHELIFPEVMINALNRYKYTLDDQILQKKTAFLDTVTELYSRQIKYADSLIAGLKNKKIEFSADDTLWIGGLNESRHKYQLHRRWEQWIKYLVLWSLQRNGDSLVNDIVSQSEKLQKSCREVLDREICRLKLKINSPGGLKDFTGQIYLKAVSGAYDPHTIYLTESERKQFETKLSSSSGLFGIKVDLNLMGEIEIRELMPGGPAWNSGKINEGDVILEIRKADDTRLDLRCITLPDVHEFLSSIGGGKTRFTIRKTNGDIVTVSLRKEILDIEENTIRSFILKKNRKIGYVYLPSFYSDFSYDNFFSRGCANDLAKELIKIKKDSIVGLILDLRSNGGGLVREALKVAGVFIDNGALGVFHTRGENPLTIKDDARGSIYNGPMVVIVNSSSASASELLAAVLQDYNRALIVGSGTYGKSTMQSILPVDAYRFDSLSLYNGEPPGYISMTTGCFYRVNGKSHQKCGVIADIELPDIYQNMHPVEASFDNTLIINNTNKKTYYYPADPLPVDGVKKSSYQRLKNDPAFRLVKSFQKLVPRFNTRYPVPLKVESFLEHFGQLEDLEDSIRVEEPYYTVMLPDYLQSKNLLTDHEKTDIGIIIQSISSDIYINEAYKIMNDLIALLTDKKEAEK